MAQSFGWCAGVAFAFLTLVAGIIAVKLALRKPFGGLSRKQQHRLFLAYWQKLERKERYEELEDLRPLLLAYQEGKQPSRKELKPYKLVTNTELKANESGLRFVTTRRIRRADA